MNQPSDDDRKQVALQRYEVIAPLLKRPMPRGAQKVILEELAGKMHLDAQNRLVYLGKRTIERYLSKYLKFGLKGLKPKIRPELGVLKAFPQEALDEAVKIRLTLPALSADSIIEVLRSDQVPGVEQMCVSTLNRHFRRLGKDRPALKRVVRKRYRLLSVEGAHVLWICDVWDGPYLYHETAGKKRRLRLVAILDAYTRYIVHAEFYFNENRPCLEDALLKAILKFQLPEIFYADYAEEKTMPRKPEDAHYNLYFQLKLRHSLVNMILCQHHPANKFFRRCSSAQNQGSKLKRTNQHGTERNEKSPLLRRVYQTSEKHLHVAGKYG